MIGQSNIYSATSEWDKFALVAAYPSRSPYILYSRPSPPRPAPKGIFNPTYLSFESLHPVNKSMDRVTSDMPDMMTYDALPYESTLSLYESLLEPLPSGWIKTPSIEPQSTMLNHRNSIGYSSGTNASLEDEYTFINNSRLQSQCQSEMRHAMEEAQSRAQALNMQLPRPRKDVHHHAKLNSASSSSKVSKSSKYKTQQYRFRMRGASAASLWAAWQDSSVTDANSMTMRVFNASRQRSSA